MVNEKLNSLMSNFLQRYFFASAAILETVLIQNEIDNKDINERVFLQRER